MGSHFYSNCCAPGRVREARVAAIQIMQWYTIQLIRLRETKAATDVESRVVSNIENCILARK